MRPIKIASRASKLALTQTNIVLNSLKKLKDDLEISIVEVSTKGDRDKSDFLYKSESMGFFTSEVENALLDGRADIAIHSLKDLPTAITKGLIIAATPKRESVADALIAADQVASITDLPTGATVGTSSIRRIAQLQHIRKDLKCVPLRGNVETRISKVAAGKVDAAIVACAGLNRLGLSEKISAVLAPEKFFTAPGQGALAIQLRDNDKELIELVSQLSDEHTQITTSAERQILAKMHGGCSIPLGVYTKIDGDIITIEAMISDVDSDKKITLTNSGKLKDAQTIAEDLAMQLLNAGGKQILENIRTAKDQ